MEHDFLMLLHMCNTLQKVHAHLLMYNNLYIECMVAIAQLAHSNIMYRITYPIHSVAMCQLSNCNHAFADVHLHDLQVTIYMCHLHEIPNTCEPLTTVSWLLCSWEYVRVLVGTWRRQEAQGHSCCASLH